jgi:hypothetical protein
MSILKAIVIPAEHEAREVLENLRKLLDLYKQVTMGDYLELVGVASSYSDEKIGWTELNDISIKSDPEGFVLDLPEPKKLNVVAGAFPFLKGWWVVVDVPDDQTYEGWLVDEIGDTMILRTEPSQIQLGIQMNSINKIDAYRKRPAFSE